MTLYRLRYLLDVARSRRDLISVAVLESRIAAAERREAVAG